MKTEKQKMGRISLRIRDNCPEHQALLYRCRNRDQNKYKSMTDYIAAAVEALEEENYITIHMDINAMTKEEQEAVNILLQHRG